jgi:hypothetical protein
MASRDELEHRLWRVAEMRAARYDLELSDEARRRLQTLIRGAVERMLVEDVADDEERWERTQALKAGLKRLGCLTDCRSVQASSRSSR